MPRFTKYNNPNKRKPSRKRNRYSQDYIEQQRQQLYKELANAQTEEQKAMIIKAFSISINP